MPYFYDPNRNLNLLLIHIPKTGGTSLEKFFSVKYNIPLDHKSLWSSWSTLERGIPNYISYQHQTYSMLKNHNDFFNIHFTKDIKIISVVRNPYERVISDLFYFNMMNKNTTKEELPTILQKYFNENIIFLDNHKIPQYKYLIDDKGKLIENIILLRTETLNNDMYDLGYKDFQCFENEKKERINPYFYLNQDSIRMINQYYEKDFIMFGYKMK